MLPCYAGASIQGGQGGRSPPKNFLRHIGTPVTPTLGPFQKQKKHKTPLLRFKNLQYMGLSVNIAPLFEKSIDAPGLTDVIFQFLLKSAEYCKN